MYTNHSSVRTPQASKLGRILGRVSLLLALVIILLIVACISDVLRWSRFGLLQMLMPSATLVWMLVLLVNLLGMSIGIFSISRSEGNSRLGLAGVILNGVVGAAVFIAPALFVLGIFAYVFSHPVR